MDLPSWSGLRDELVLNALERETELPDEEKDGRNAALERISEETDLWHCFSQLKDMLPKHAYEDCIRSSLEVESEKIPGSYDLLWQLNIKGILTFNIDTCAVHSFSRVNKSAVDTATSKDVAKFSKFMTVPQQFVFQPHGHISDPESWVFTSTERDHLLNNADYTKYMTTLQQSMHLLILGFNPTDFSFEYLMQNALTSTGNTGSKHYLFLPRTAPGLIKSYSERGYAVIPYSPDDDSHPEIEASLKDFLAYVPRDVIPGSVFTGDRIEASGLPSDDDLLQCPVEETRRLLNGAIANIIPPDGAPREEDIEILENFYDDHIRAIHMAWLIKAKSEWDTVHGYKVINTKGRGAFGQVYQCENIVSKERAALKVLLPEVRGDPEYLNSFRRGVHSMKILSSRNVKKMVRIIDAFEIPACVFMEYIEGPTLTEAQDWGLLKNLDDCLDVLIQIGEVVHEAHNLEERVLHRDLKPDNVILKDCYHNSDPLNVTVLDFDLSWHKGAMDLSVVHGARAQGYAAPEQTATGKTKGISTRHTAVDVFGYGMLAYFLFVGQNPRPNEQNFSGFEENIKEAITQRFSVHWRCLPAYLARTIVQCTYDLQADRMAFASAVASFREAHQMTGNDTIDDTNPLILQEIGSRVEPEGRFEIADFGRQIRVSGGDESKQISLKLESENNKVIVNVEISKVRSEAEHRHVVKYLDKAKNKAVSSLNVSPFTAVKGEIGRSRLDLYAKWPLNQTVSISDIEKVSNIIGDSRYAMELGY